MKLSAACSLVFEPRSLTNSGKAPGWSQKFPTGGPLANQTVLWGCAPQDSLISLGTSLGKFFSDNPAAFSLFFRHFYWRSSHTLLRVGVLALTLY